MPAPYMNVPEDFLARLMVTVSTAAVYLHDMPFHGEGRSGAVSRLKMVAELCEVASSYAEWTEGRKHLIQASDGMLPEVRRRVERYAITRITLRYLTSAQQMVSHRHLKPGYQPAGESPERLRTDMLALLTAILDEAKGLRLEPA